MLVAPSLVDEPRPSTAINALRLLRGLKPVEGKPLEADRVVDQDLGDYIVQVAPHDPFHFGQPENYTDNAPEYMRRRKPSFSTDSCSSSGLSSDVSFERWNEGYSTAPSSLGSSASCNSLTVLVPSDCGRKILGKGLQPLTKASLAPPISSQHWMLLNLWEQGLQQQFSGLRLDFEGTHQCMEMVNGYILVMERPKGCTPRDLVHFSNCPLDALCLATLLKDLVTLAGRIHWKRTEVFLKHYVWEPESEVEDV